MAAVLRVVRRRRAGLGREGRVLVFRCWAVQWPHFLENASAAAETGRSRAAGRGPEPQQQQRRGARVQKLRWQWERAPFSREGSTGRWHRRPIYASSPSVFAAWPAPPARGSGSMDDRRTIEAISVF